MAKTTQKNFIFFGIRIGLAFLAAVMLLSTAAYYVISGNVEKLLVNYSFKLFDSMVKQGVMVVDRELETSLREAVLLADAYAAALASDKNAPLPAMHGAVRTLYVSGSGTISSDGRSRDARNRRDVREALRGKASIEGPKFNEDGEFIISYTAPVRQGGRVVGALSGEKDGYIFCTLIADFRFMDSGESYIINAEGTDIAVSDPRHISWVQNEYNARKLLAEKEDPVTRSVFELERKGLNGETGRGSYIWNDGIAYVSYAPVNAQPWVFLTGIREEELALLTKTAFYSSLFKGHALPVCFGVFALLAILIVFWIISGMRKSEEINRKLEQLANIDTLTGLYNRRYLENVIEPQWRYPVRVSGHAAVFIADIDDFKKYNDRFGHPEGDTCLRRIAGVFRDALHGFDSFAMRYGGEEFVAVAFQMDRQAALRVGRSMCRLVEAEGIPAPDGGSVTLSVGLCYAEITSAVSLQQCIERADAALYEAKRQGKNRCVFFDAAEARMQAQTPPSGCSCP